MKSFEYLFERRATGQVDIEDVGNCAIVAYNSFIYQKMILIIKTVEGQTRVVISGPCWAELEGPCCDYTYTFQSFQFNSRKIENIIERFLNGKFFIDQAESTTVDDAIKQLPDVRLYIND